MIAMEVRDKNNSGHYQNLVCLFFCTEMVNDLPIGTFRTVHQQRAIAIEDIDCTSVPVTGRLQRDRTQEKYLWLKEALRTRVWNLSLRIDQSPTLLIK